MAFSHIDGRMMNGLDVKVAVKVAIDGGITDKGDEWVRVNFMHGCEC